MLNQFHKTQNTGNQVCKTYIITIVKLCFNLLYIFFFFHEHLYVYKRVKSNLIDSSPVINAPCPHIMPYFVQEDLLL